MIVSYCYFYGRMQKLMVCFYQNLHLPIFTNAQTFAFSLGSNESELKLQQQQQQSQIKIIWCVWRWLAAVRIGYLPWDLLNIKRMMRNHKMNTHMITHLLNWLQFYYALFKIYVFMRIFTLEKGRHGCWIIIAFRDDFSFLVPSISGVHYTSEFLIV